MTTSPETPKGTGMTRRNFLQTAAAGAALAATNPLGGLGFGAPSGKRPNILFILTDQQHIDTIRAGGCEHVHSPNLDRLYKRGVRFTNSYCTQPVCIPSRSSMLTGRMPTETGLYFNSARAGQLEESTPTLGEWLGDQAGYQTIYSGKWHLPACHTYNCRGFDTISSGLHHWGDVTDELVSRSCGEWLQSRDRSRPFFMVASFIQPHDICMWLSINTENQERLRYPEIADELPPLPPNFEPPGSEPKHVVDLRERQQPALGEWDPAQWRYYFWNYYRHVEMVDAEIGRLLDALEASGAADDTIIAFTSDHGEGMGEHRMVRKGYLYDACCQVPLIVSWPGRMDEDRSDEQHLVSGLDIVPTLCDYVGVPAPAGMRGASLRPLLEGNDTSWQRPVGHFVVTAECGQSGRKQDVREQGRRIRSERYSYVKYYNDETDQLFDLQADPGEMTNLAGDSQYASVVEEHREMLREFEKTMDYAPRCVEAHAEAWRTL